METISLENAKKLHEVAKEKGVELPESEYVYANYRTRIGKPDGISSEVIEVSLGLEYRIISTSDFKKFAGSEPLGIKSIKSYTTDELLEWLPEMIEMPSRGGDARLYLRKFVYEDYKYIAYYQIGCAEPDYTQTATTLADALCLLAIELIKSGVIK